MNSIVFINPPTPDNRKITRNCDCASESKGNYLLQPFDFLYLSSKVKHDETFKYIDAVADEIKTEEVFRLLSVESCAVFVVAIVDLTWEMDFLFVEQLRGKFPESVILVFGDALVEDLNREKILKLADGIIESSFLFDVEKVRYCTRDDVWNLKLDGFSSDAKMSKKSKEPKMVSLGGVPKFEKFRRKNYVWPFAKHREYVSIGTNWGCVYKCSYCIDSVFPFYYREAKEIINEIECVKMLGIKEIVFTDKVFGLPRENTFKLLEYLEGENISWSTYIHPLQCDFELLKKMKSGGCHTVIMGIESQNFETLKKYDRSADPGKVGDILKICSSLGLSVCGDFLIGLKGQSFEDVLELIKFSKSLELTYASFNILAPLPGSSVRREGVEEGLLSEDSHHFDSLGGSGVYSSGTLTREELIKLRNKANREFYIRIRTLIKIFFDIKSAQAFRLRMLDAWFLFKKNYMIRRKHV